MKKLLIIADENISGLEHFSAFAEIQKLPGRSISKALLNKADALLVRSVTAVNESLLEGSRLRFVGSTTSGYDHVDLEYLRKNNIHFAYAPGSNANAVIQYVFASLAMLSERFHFDWRQYGTGIIGGGHIGTLLAEFFQQLSMQFVIHDPYLDASYRFADRLVPLQEALQQSIISLHTSLEKSGSFPSFHLLDANSLAIMNRMGILINAARGAVIDNEALEAYLKDNSACRCVLDVWEHEPEISQSLLQRVCLGTPHIAGYSLEGKEQGSAAVHRALLNFFDLKKQHAFPLSEKKQMLSLTLPAETLAQINQTILAAYNPAQDHEPLLQGTAQSDVGMARTFDGLRKNYPLRREFTHFTLPAKLYSDEALSVLSSLGFSYF